MQICALKRDEKEKFVDMALASWRAAYVGYLPEEEVANAPNMLRQAVDKRCEELQVLRDDNDNFLGFYSLGEGNYLWHLYVHPDHFRKGYGQVLLASAEATIRERGFGSVTLDVMPENDRAIAFYSAQGFVVTGRDEDDYLLMEKQLG